jgi:allantoin racemase
MPEGRTVSRVLVLGSGPPPKVGQLHVHLREQAARGIGWRIEPTRVGGFPFTPLDVVLTELGHVDAALRAAPGSADAVLLDTFGEYGLAAMRSGLVMPVIGAAEAALAEARLAGPRFGIVTVWPESMDWLYQRQLRLLDSRENCVGIRYVGGAAASEQTPRETLGAMHREDAGWIGRIASAMQSLVDEGASSIVLGCTCMAPVWEALAGRASVPVICAARAGVRAVLSTLDSAGSHAATQGPPASITAVKALVDFVDRGPAATDQDAACPVCITAPE